MASSSSPNCLVQGLANKNEYSGGGTALIIEYKDGLILATDIRETSKNRAGKIKIVSETQMKLILLNERMAVTVTGGTMSGNAIFQYLKNKYSRAKWVNVSSLEVARDAEMYMKEVCDENTLLLANFNLNKKYQELYQVDQNGRTLMHGYACSGLGGKFAIEKVQEKFEVDMSLDSAVKLALCAIHHASTKDQTTGAKAMVWQITAEGVSKVTCLSFEELGDKSWE